MNSPTNNPMQTLIEVANHVAAQNSEWRFIATPILFGIFAALVGKYFMAQYERLIQDHKIARDQYHESLREIVKDQNDTTLKLTVIIERNTQALDACLDELKHCRDRRG